MSNLVSEEMQANYLRNILSARYLRKEMQLFDCLTYTLTTDGLTRIFICVLFIYADWVLFRPHGTIPPILGISRNYWGQWE